jgi:hypothetical protein
MDKVITYVKDEGSNLNTLAINIIFNGYMCPFSTWTIFFKFFFWPCNVKNMSIYHKWHKVLCWHEEDVIEKWTISFAKNHYLD